MRFFDAVLLTVIVAAALAFPLRSPPIAAHGEAREGLVVQDIVINGEWVLPHRNGELPSKPPLFHWIAAATAYAVGLSDVAVRTPSAIAAWVMVLVTFAFGAAAGGRLTGWLAAGALLGMHGFWESAWEARVDMVFAAAITAALVAFFFWYRTGRALARAGAYLAIGCAVLAKGPAGAAIPVLVIAAFVTRESWRRHRGTSEDASGGAGAPATLGAPGAGPLAHAVAVVRRFWSWPLAAAVVAVDAGWYGLAYLRGGREFLQVQLLRENVDRLVGRGVFGLHGGRSRLTMLIELATDLVPWNLALVWAAVAWMRGARADVAERFLHAWWIVVVALFTAAYGKRDIYLLPLYPAVALLAGRALARAIASASSERVLGVVRIPRVLRRRFPTRPALALVAVAIVVFDTTLVTVSELTRVHQAHRKSLLGFIATLEREVPRNAALFAARDLDGSDVQVVAYRLARAIPRAPDSLEGVSGPAYVLTPVANGEPAGDDHARRIAVSHRRGTNVALEVLAPAGAAAAVAK